MRFSILVISFITFFVSCGKDARIPASVLPPDKMQALLWDLMRADQFLGNYVFNRDTSVNKTAESLKYYEQIFALHKVSRETYQESFAYYRSHPDLFKQVMDSISVPDAAITAPINPLPSNLAPDTGSAKIPVIKTDTFKRRKIVDPLRPD